MYLKLVLKRSDGKVFIKTSEEFTTLKRVENSLNLFVDLGTHSAYAIYDKDHKLVSQRGSIF